VIRADDIASFEKAVAAAQQSTTVTVIHVQTDPLAPAPDSPAWWDVPVAEVSGLATTQSARATYEKAKATQRPHLTPPAPATHHSDAKEYHA